ncbi:MAG: AEC family transporter [bacterium]|nr:AEC family transporter [bacterium]
MNTFSIILPVLLLVAAGYYLRRFELMPEEWTHTLNGFVYHVALPALVVAGFWGIPWQVPGLAKLIGAGVLAFIAFALLVGILLALTPMNRRTKASVFLAAVVGNSIYMGFPIADGAFGDGHTAVVALGTIFLVIGILIAIAGIEVFWEPERTRAYLRSLARNPLAIALVMGIAVGFSGWGVGGIVHQTFGIVGATASPIALIALGAFLRGTFVRDAAWHAALATALRLLIAPVVVFLGIALIGSRFQELGIATILAAMPVAVTTMSVADELDLEQSVVASSIVMSTLLALVTVPLILLLWA